MRPRGRAIWIGLGALWCVALGYAFGHDRLLSLSVDISHHLQLVDIFRDHWRVPAEFQGYLLETYIYPKFSHRFAALFDRTGVGEISALTIAGVTAAAVGWLLLFDQARRVSLPVLAAAFVLAALAARQLTAAMGQEIANYFFYPQLISEAVFIGGAVLGAWSLARSRGLFILVAAAAVWVCGNFHLVGALKLAGTLMALGAFEIAADVLARRRLDWRPPLAILAAAAAVLGNPAFWVMRTLAAHEGGIAFRVPLSLGHLGAAAGVLLILSAWVAIAALARNRQSWREVSPAWRAAILIAAMGAAGAGAALAQLAAFVLLGEGSSYAVLKHTFGVASLLALAAPVWLWSLTARAEMAPRLPVLGAAAAVVAQAALIWLMFHHASVIDVADTRRVFEAIREFRIAQGLKGGESEALFASAKRWNNINFAASVSILRAQRSTNALGLHYKNQLVTPETSPLIVTEPGDPDYDVAGCRLPASTATIVVVRGACAVPPRLWFGTGGAGPAFLADGWSDPEPGGVWSIAERAVVELPLPKAAVGDERPRSLHIATLGFTPPTSPRRAVRVSVAGGSSEDFTFDRDRALGHIYILEVPKAALAAGKATLVFEVREPLSPKAAGQGEDTRRLGLTLQGVSLFPRSAGPLPGATQAP